MTTPAPFARRFLYLDPELLGAPTDAAGKPDGYTRMAADGSLYKALGGAYVQLAGGGGAGGGAALGIVQAADLPVFSSPQFDYDWTSAEAPSTQGNRWQVQSEPASAPDWGLAPQHPQGLQGFLFAAVPAGGQELVSLRRFDKDANGNLSSPQALLGSARLRFDYRRSGGFTSLTVLLLRSDATLLRRVSLFGEDGVWNTQTLLLPAQTHAVVFLLDNLGDQVGDTSLAVTNIELATHDVVTDQVALVQTLSLGGPGSVTELMVGSIYGLLALRPEAESQPARSKRVSPSSVTLELTAGAAVLLEGSVTSADIEFNQPRHWDQSALLRLTATVDAAVTLSAVSLDQAADPGSLSPGSNVISAGAPVQAFVHDLKAGLAATVSARTTFLDKAGTGLSIGSGPLSVQPSKPGMALQVSASVACSLTVDGEHSTVIAVHRSPDGDATPDAGGGGK